MSIINNDRGYTKVQGKVNSTSHDNCHDDHTKSKVMG